MTDVTPDVLRDDPPADESTRHGDRPSAPGSPLRSLAQLRREAIVGDDHLHLHVPGFDADSTRLAVRYHRVSNEERTEASRGADRSAAAAARAEARWLNVCCDAIVLVDGGKLDGIVLTDPSNPRAPDGRDADGPMRFDRRLWRALELDGSPPDATEAVSALFEAVGLPGHVTRHAAALLRWMGWGSDADGLDPT